MQRAVIRRKSGDNSEAKRDGGVQSVDRALLLIETLAEDDEGYCLTDLAVRTGLPPSTVHRLLIALERRRFVQFDRSGAIWHIGVRSFSVGSTFARRKNLLTHAIPYLRRLRDRTHETANFAVVDDASIIVLTRTASREIMRSLTNIGGRVAMAASGVGKAVLATYPDEDVHLIIRRHGMPRMTEKSIIRPGKLLEELQLIRRQGYAVDDEEACIGLRCVAAAVYNDCGEPLAAISVSGTSSRITDKQLPKIGKIVCDAAAEITAALGGVVPALPRILRRKRSYRSSAGSR
jgi:IclR family acetate operon transcriptional repressor